MPLTNNVTNYLPTIFEDDQGNVYKIKRTVLLAKTSAGLLGKDWEEIDRKFSLDDGTEAVTDDAEDTFTLLTKPPKHLKPKPNP